MKVFITGGTGYVGNAVVKELLNHHHQVVCLVRKGSEGKLGKIVDEVELRFGDATQPETLNINQCDAIIHLIGIIKEVPEKGITFEKLNFGSAVNMIDLAKKEGVKRFLYMSAAGSAPGIASGYYDCKIKAENYLKESGLDWTIFKPSLIYDKSVIGKSMGWISLFNLPWTLAETLPVVGKLAQKWHPISKTQIAKDYVHALENKQYIGKTLMGKELFDMI